MLERVDLVEQLRASLRGALETRDMIAASALRSALAAIASADALSEAEIARIVHREAEERQIAAAECERFGYIDRARRLRREAKVLAAATDGAIG